MVNIKSQSEIAKLRKAGQITGGALVAAGKAIRPGMTTKELDNLIPGAACISVNDVVIHGIPGGYVLKEGDIVSVDTGAYIDGVYGDSAKTFAVGEISDEAKALMKSSS